MKTGWRLPITGDARLRRSHRDLGRAAGDQRGEDHTDGVPVCVTGLACEQQTTGSIHASRSGRNAGIGRLEAETVRTLDRVRFLVQPASQVQKFSSAATRGEPSSEAPPSLRSQRRGYEEASGLGAEYRVHAQEVLLHTKRVVNASNDHFSDRTPLGRTAEVVANMRAPRNLIQNHSMVPWRWATSLLERRSASRSGYHLASAGSFWPVECSSICVREGARGSASLRVTAFRPSRETPSLAIARRTLRRRTIVAARPGKGFVWQ